MDINNTKISVIIPTLNAGKELQELLSILHKQSRNVDEIIVVDSSSIDETVSVCNNDSLVKLIQIKRQEFDHGRTRDMALRRSIGDIVVFLTQDAIPKDVFFIDNLIKPFSDNQVAACTGRQLPKANATMMEQLVRQYNYPKKSHIRSKSDIQTMGIKAFFFSDVCAAYRKDIYLKIGGFDYPIETNEDMFYAAAVINSGYKIAYVAEAEVYHSHNLKLKDQYKRNYLQGYEIERHKDILSNVSQEHEGIKLVSYVSKGLLQKGRLIMFIRFGLDCCARLIGSKAGRKAFYKQCSEK